MLEDKLAILKSLNTQVEGEDEDTFSFNIHGFEKSIRMDKLKFMESLTM